MRKKDKSEFSNWWIIILLVILIIIFVITLGQVDIGKRTSLPQAFKDSKEEARLKHDRLKALIEKQEKLKKKLQIKFKWIYFGVRLTFILFWGIYLFVLYFVNHINDLEDVLNYSEAIILLSIVLNFLTFGSFTNVQSFVNLIKTRLENWIWGKYIDIQERIDQNKVALVDLESMNDEKKEVGGIEP